MTHSQLLKGSPWYSDCTGLAVWIRYEGDKDSGYCHIRKCQLCGALITTRVGEVVAVEEPQRVEVAP